MMGVRIRANSTFLFYFILLHGCLHSKRLQRTTNSNANRPFRNYIFVIHPIQRYMKSVNETGMEGWDWAKVTID